jgi:hypothetical protein
VNGVIAEKIFLTLYVLLFIGGFYLLVKKISNGHPYWPLVIFIFVFNYPLFKGFYNFSFSIAFYLWMVWSWLRFLEKGSVSKAMLFFLFVTLAFFTHLLAFVFGAITCAALVLSYAAATDSGTAKQKTTHYFLKYCGSLALLMSPFLALMYWFTKKEGGMQIGLRHHFYRLAELIKFKYIVDITHQEESIAAIAGIILLIIFCASLIRFRKHSSINKYDGFLVSLLFAGFVYLFFPEDFLGRSILISMRVQLYIFIIIVCCISYMLPFNKMKNSGGIILFACFIVLSIVRIPCQLLASEGVSEYVSCAGYIRPHSVLLPLDFSQEGKDKNGKIIADRNWLFCHTSGYLGLEKPLIDLDNYEANIGYFPISWNDGVNPYIHLDKNGMGSYPRYAAINEYKKNAGVTIDYIVMWCYDPSYLQNEYFSKMYTEINALYHLVYTSQTGRILLFEKNV